MHIEGLEDLDDSILEDLKAVEAALTSYINYVEDNNLYRREALDAVQTAVWKMNNIIRAHERKQSN
jgi:hypothetical protein